MARMSSRADRNESRAVTLTRKATRRAKYTSRPLSAELLAGVTR